MTRAFPHLPRGGFTLLELVVSTLIFAVVVGSLFTVVQGAILMRERMYETLETPLPRSHAAAVIRRDLAGCVAPSGLLFGALLGEKEEERGVRIDQITLFTTSGIVDPAHPWGDLQRVQYRLDEVGETDFGTEWKLVRSVTRNLLASTEEDPAEETLLSGVASLTFRYYDGEQWQDSWDANARAEMPQAIVMLVEYLPTEAERPAQPALEVSAPVVMTMPETAAPAAGGTGGGQAR